MDVYNWLVQHTGILGLAIDFTALIVTIVLTIGIYQLERRHQKDREAAEKRAQELAVAEAAKVFLIDNDEDLEYLPLAEIAAKLKLRRKHHRNLITRYLRCNEQQKQEILRQANIPDIQISMDQVYRALEKLQKDLDKYHFGKNILYDGAKYLHRAFERWREVSVNDVTPCIFENLKTDKYYIQPSKISKCFFAYKVTLFNYIFDYLNAEKLGIDKSEVMPPINMVFEQCNLGFCDEPTMTFWTMRIIIDACCAIHGFPDKLCDQDLLQTQEDMYYYTLATLCLTYPDDTPVSQPNS